MFGNRGSGPYSRPLKVKVIKRDEAMTYRGGDGNQRQALSCAVSDGSSTAKLVCYDPAQFSRLSVGNTVLVRECIRKMEDTQPTIIVTKASKIFLTGAIDVPEHHQVEANNILNPPPAETLPIKSALQSPVKRKVSVVGKIVQVCYLTRSIVLYLHVLGINR